MPNVSTASPFPCTGCGTCVVLCGKAGVKLELDNTGFYQSIVDQDICVDCGMCLAACARFSAEFDGEIITGGTLYACRSNNAQVARAGSSGGLAHEIARHIIQKGGKSVGATYNLATDRVEHCIVERAEDIWRTDGTKYLQSDVSATFRAVLKDARRNKDSLYVLFGTPCQIQGFSDACFLYNDARDRIILVEFFCQGVAGYKLWEAECAAVRQQLGDGPFDSVNFRSEDAEWHSHCLKITKGDQVYLGNSQDDLFYQAFFEKALLSEACITCRQHGLNSAADIRLGDFWGKRFEDQSQGITAALAITPKGQQLMDELVAAQVLDMFEVGDVEELIEAQPTEDYSLQHQAMHKEAMRVLGQSGDVATAIKAYRSLQAFWDK